MNRDVCISLYLIIAVCIFTGSLGLFMNYNECHERANDINFIYSLVGIKVIPHFKPYNTCTFEVTHAD